jgi:hypothetical protein
MLFNYNERSIILAMYTHLSTYLRIYAYIPRFLKHVFKKRTDCNYHLNICRMNLNSYIELTLIYDVMIVAGYRNQSRPSSHGLEFRWMLLVK